MNGRWTITKEISIGIIIEIVFLVSAGIAFIVHVDRKLTRIETVIDLHLKSPEIHQTLVQKEKLFPRRSEFEGLKKKVDKYIDKNGGK